MTSLIGDHIQVLIMDSSYHLCLKYEQQHIPLISLFSSYSEFLEKASLQSTDEIKSTSDKRSTASRWDYYQGIEWQEDQNS